MELLIKFDFIYYIEIYKFLHPLNSKISTQKMGKNNDKKSLLQMQSINDNYLNCYSS